MALKAPRPPSSRWLRSISVHRQLPPGSFRSTQLMLYYICRGGSVLEIYLYFLDRTRWRLACGVWPLSARRTERPLFACRWEGPCLQLGRSISPRHLHPPTIFSPCIYLLSRYRCRRLAGARRPPGRLPILAQLCRSSSSRLLHPPTETFSPLSRYITLPLPPFWQELASLQDALFDMRGKARPGSPCAVPADPADPGSLDPGVWPECKPRRASDATSGSAASIPTPRTPGGSSAAALDASGPMLCQLQALLFSSTEVRINSPTIYVIDRSGAAPPAFICTKSPRRRWRIVGTRNAPLTPPPLPSFPPHSNPPFQMTAPPTLRGRHAAAAAPSRARGCPRGSSARSTASAAPEKWPSPRAFGRTGRAAPRFPGRPRPPRAAASRCRRRPAYG